MFMRRILTFLALIPLLATPSLASEIEARVIVPDAPGGAVVSGCFRADRPLFGPHWLTMCLRNRGTYTVTGGGITCNGRLTWTANGRNIRINIRRQSCNRGVAWAAATVSCTGTGVVWGILDRLFNPPGASGRVVVPNAPAVRNLHCTYHPTVRGERDTFFIARRT
jgi:hypothetical protein